MKKLLFIYPIHEQGMQLAAARDDVISEVIHAHDEASIQAAIRDAHGVLVRSAHITRPIIEVAEQLMIVSRHGVGYDTVDQAALTERGIPLTIVPGANAVSVAEHTMFLILALAKRARLHDRQVRDGQFALARGAMVARDVDTKTLLIVGFGRTGSSVAPRAKAFGMRVLVYDPYIDPKIITSAGCEPVDDFKQALGQADVLSIHTPKTSETSGMIGDVELRALPQGALLVCTARGGIVREDALDRALRSHHLGGAGLDVFEAEPQSPPSDHPLFDHDNVILSPHIAGVSLEAGIRMGCMSVQNILDCFDGRLDPDVVVNKEVLMRT